MEEVIFSFHLEIALAHSFACLYMACDGFKENVNKTKFVNQAWISEGLFVGT